MMLPLLIKLFYNLPIEIILKEIVPLIPKFHLSEEVLALQKKKIVLYNFITSYFPLEKDEIKPHLFRHYKGGNEYVYDSKKENNIRMSSGIYLYVNTKTNDKNDSIIITDYFCIFF